MSSICPISSFSLRLDTKNGLGILEAILSIQHAKAIIIPFAWQSDFNMHIIAFSVFSFHKIVQRVEVDPIIFDNLSFSKSQLNNYL